MNRRRFILAMVLVLAAAGELRAEELEARARTLLSEIAAMSRGHYAASLWADRVAQARALSAQARAEGKVNVALELELVRGLIMAQAERRPEEASALLDQLHRDYPSADPQLRRRLYAARAEVYSMLGREAAIAELIREYTASPLYDPEGFEYELQEGRDTPLRIRRPKARGADSITVTTMEKFRQSARHAAGEAAPLIEGVDLQGQPLRLEDYRGRLVLIDFWNPGWTAWQRDLAALKKLHRDYAAEGFEIIGIPLGLLPDQLQEQLRAGGMTWRQLRDARGAARQYSVFGEARNFLVNQDGVIIGRDLRGSDLRLAVQRALERDL